MSLQALKQRVRRPASRLLRGAVRAGVPPAWIGYRQVLAETLPQYVARMQPQDPRVGLQTIHAPAVADNPLPRNVADPTKLPAEAGWWGYSFRDVPSRRSGATLIATLPDCRVVPFVDANREFWPALLSPDQRSIELREIRFRPWHAEVVRSAPTVRLEKAVWALERVYHNYSHWLTAHLPKLVLLQQLGRVHDVVLPEKRPRFIDDSLNLLQIDVARLRTFDPGAMLAVGELTVLGTDRFRPELLQPVRAAMPVLGDPQRRRRVFISREGAERRRLLNEDEIWKLLAPAGFERVLMEALTFREQVALMQETAVLCAPHGAGLTNMLFCRPGTCVIELADLAFPNPNFYAVATAMQLPYYLVRAEGVGEQHPLEKDLRVDPARVRAVLREVNQALSAT